MSVANFSQKEEELSKPNSSPKVKSSRVITQ